MAKGNIPKDQTDFLHVAEAVLTKWIANPWLTLQYILVGEFQLLVNQYRTELTGRTTEGATRPAETQTLENLDEQIDKGVGKVKKYIADKYEDEDPTAYYPQFGIVHITSAKNSHWAMPYDRDERLESLTMMTNAINTHGFNAKTYGNAYWSAILGAYPSAWQAARDTDSTVSGHVGNLSVLRNQINEVLVSIAFVLRGNYPKNFSNVWREWGFQREDY